MKRRNYREIDFLRIRDFLIETHSKFNKLHNWSIDRWNFSRYFGQVMHKTVDSWPATVGIWVDDNDEIKAIVNSEGENRGEAFFQVRDIDYSKDKLYEMLDFAEENFKGIHEGKRFLNFRMKKAIPELEEIITERGYKKTKWNEPVASMPINHDFEINLPDGFEIVSGDQVSAFQKGVAHAKAFGYYDPDDLEDSENCYKSVKNAPDYRSDLDLYMVKDDEIAAFATIWFDQINNFGTLEPVGTLPEFRRKGLAKILIHEGLNRLRKNGALKIYVGSDQEFYLAIGFKVDFSVEIWQRIFVNGESK